MGSITEKINDLLIGLNSNFISEKFKNGNASFIIDVKESETKSIRVNVTADLYLRFSLCGDTKGEAIQQNSRAYKIETDNEFFDDPGHLKNILEFAEELDVESIDFAMDIYLYPPGTPYEEKETFFEVEILPTEHTKKFMRNGIGTKWRAVLIGSYEFTSHNENGKEERNKVYDQIELINPDGNLSGIRFGREHYKILFAY